MEPYLPFESFMLSGEPVWVWNSDKRSIWWANAAARLMWGAETLDALKRRRFPAKAAGLKRLSEIARAHNGAGQWAGPIELPLANGPAAIECQTQRLELSGGDRGVIVKTALGGQAAQGAVKKKPQRSPAPPMAKAAAPKARRSAALVAPPLKTEGPKEKPPAKGTATGKTARAPRARASELAFLASLSHDLRNPLTAIIGFAEMLRGASGPELASGKVAEYAGDILKSACLALDLSNDLLAYSRRRPPAGAPPLGAVAAGACVKECARLVAPLARHGGVDLCVNADAALPAILIRERSLQQILLNVLLNSVKFTAPGGEIKIKAAVNASGALIVAISDSGGKPQETASLKVTDSLVLQGAGLGLINARQALKEAGAAMQRRKRRAGGMSVKLLFPAALLRAREALEAARVHPDA